jgi:hypothetical protein
MPVREEGAFRGRRIGKGMLKGMRGSEGRGSGILEGAGGEAYINCEALHYLTLTLMNSLLSALSEPVSLRLSLTRALR